MTSQEINKFAAYMHQNQVFSLSKDGVELVHINGVVTVFRQHPTTTGIQIVKRKKVRNGKKSQARKRSRVKRSTKTKTRKSKAS